MGRKGYQFSSANSINIGRLVPQIVYYVYAYTRLLKDGKIKGGEAVNVAVPTGNFGNILAAFYAKNMGLPIHKLIVHPMKIRCCMTFSVPGCTIRTENLY